MATLSLAQMAMYARSAGLPGDPYLWAAIGMGESSGRTDVVNSIGCVGVWQINQPVHVKTHPTWTVAWLKNPANNAKAAKVIYNAQGFSAWEAYTDGSYKQYYKSGSTATNASYSPEDLASDLVVPGSGILGSLTGSDAVSQVTDAAQIVSKAASWMSNPQNWVRVAYVIGGGAIILVTLNSMMQGSLMKNPIVQGAMSVAPGGGLIKKATK